MNNEQKRWGFTAEDTEERGGDDDDDQDDDFNHKDTKAQRHEERRQ